MLTFYINIKGLSWLDFSRVVFSNIRVTLLLNEVDNVYNICRFQALDIGITAKKPSPLYVYSRRHVYMKKKDYASTGI